MAGCEPWPGETPVTIATITLIQLTDIAAPSVTFPVSSADIADIMSDGDLDLSLSPVKKNVAKQVKQPF